MSLMEREIDTPRFSVRLLGAELVRYYSVHPSSAGLINAWMMGNYECSTSFLTC